MAIGKNMIDLTQDELTVLLIAAEGKSMMPIGRWEGPVKSLVAKGYLSANDKFNNVITAAGRQAANQDEDNTARQMIEANNAIVNCKESARQMAEAISVQLVDLAELSNRLTGDNKITALRNWSKIILTRALEKLST